MSDWRRCGWGAKNAQPIVFHHGWPLSGDDCGKGRVAKLVLIGAVPPILEKTAANPGGLPIEVFDGLRQHQSRTVYRDFANGPSTVSTGRERRCRRR